MLSVQRCRMILGKGYSLSDSEIETLRDQLYCLADVALTSLPDQLRANTIAENFAPVSSEGGQ